jgi:hypothetical protein
MCDAMLKLLGWTRNTGEMKCHLIVVTFLLYTRGLTIAQVQDSASLFGQALVDLADNGLGVRAYQV